jgi:hypothetical protein
MSEPMTANELGSFLRVSDQHGALVNWLRAYEGFCLLSPTVSECLEKFPLLDRERVDQAIRQVRDEQEQNARAKDPMSKARQALVEWLGKDPEFNLLRPSASECLEKFPQLSRAVVESVIEELRHPKRQAVIYFLRCLRIVKPRPQRNEYEELPSDVRKELDWVVKLICDELPEKPVRVPRRKRVHERKK